MLPGGRRGVGLRRELCAQWVSARHRLQSSLFIASSSLPLRFICLFVSSSNHSHSLPPTLFHLSLVRFTSHSSNMGRITPSSILARRWISISMGVAFVVLCYMGQAHKIDNNLKIVQNGLGIHKDDHRFGSKGLDRMGRLVLKRATATCPKYDVDGCVNNVYQHRNCYPICEDNDPSFYCDSLTTIGNAVFTEAYNRCQARAKASCTLEPNANGGGYDWAAFNACCNPDPTTAPACLCTGYQLRPDPVTCAAKGLTPKPFDLRWLYRHRRSHQMYLSPPPRGFNN